MSNKIQTLSEISMDQHVKCLVYGPSGSGKTVLCATAPSPLIVSAEKGLLSLRRVNLERLFGVNNPTITYDPAVWQISTVKDLEECLSWVMTSKDADYFKTICLDSISEIAEKVLDNEKPKYKDRRMAYMPMADRMNNIIRKFRDLEYKHVVMTAKMETVKDESTGIISCLPSLPGQKFSAGVPYFLDEVFYLHSNNVGGKAERYLQTSRDFKYEAKDRSGALDLQEIPNLTLVFDKILGDFKNGTN